MTYFSTSSSFTRPTNKILSNSLLPSIPCLNLKTHSRKFSPKPLISSFILNRNLIYHRISSKTGVLLATSGDASSESGDEDNRALEAVMKLYAAMKNRNISDVSDVIGEECRCVCNFFSMFQPLMGKKVSLSVELFCIYKQVVEFFSKLMKYLGSNIQFIVKPTMHNGMDVGISWRLEWEKTHVPLGKGFGFYMCHVYRGKVLIKELTAMSHPDANLYLGGRQRNVEMFVEPIFRIEPLGLKVMGLMMTVMDKIGVGEDFKLKAKKAIYVLLALSIMTAFLFFYNLL